MAPWSRILRGAETPGGTQGKPSQILSRIDDTSAAGRGVPRSVRCGEQRFEERGARQGGGELRPCLCWAGREV